MNPGRQEEIERTLCGFRVHSLRLCSRELKKRHVGFAHSVHKFRFLEKPCCIDSTRLPDRSPFARLSDPDNSRACLFATPYPLAIYTLLTLSSTEHIEPNCGHQHAALDDVLRPVLVVQ